MPITRALLSKMLQNGSQRLIEQSDVFSKIDACFGDGDHGVSMQKIAHAIQIEVENWQDQSLKEFLDNLGVTIMGISSGSAGPLWGTLFSGLAIPIPEDALEIDGALLKAMLGAGLAELKSITAARRGDKTLMDALIPAVEAAQQTEGDIQAVLDAAAAAAARGAKDTEGYVARYGRAKNYKEKTLGTADPGALSLSVFFEGLAEGAR